MSRAQRATQHCRTWSHFVREVALACTGTLPTTTLHFTAHPLIHLQAKIVGKEDARVADTARSNLGSEKTVLNFLGILTGEIKMDVDVTAACQFEAEHGHWENVVFPVVGIARAEARDIVFDSLTLAEREPASRFPPSQPQGH